MAAFLATVQELALDLISCPDTKQMCCSGASLNTAWLAEGRVQLKERERKKTEFIALIPSWVGDAPARMSVVLMMTSGEEQQKPFFNCLFPQVNGCECAPLFCWFGSGSVPQSSWCQDRGNLPLKYCVNKTHSSFGVCAKLAKTDLEMSSQTGNKWAIMWSWALD